MGVFRDGNILGGMGVFGLDGIFGVGFILLLKVFLINSCHLTTSVHSLGVLCNVSSCYLYIVHGFSHVTLTQVDTSGKTYHATLVRM